VKHNVGALAFDQFKGGGGDADSARMCVFPLQSTASMVRRRAFCGHEKLNTQKPSSLLATVDAFVCCVDFDTPRKNVAAGVPERAGGANGYFYIFCARPQLSRRLENRARKYQYQPL